MFGFGDDARYHLTGHHRRKDRCRGDHTAPADGGNEVSAQRRGEAWVGSGLGQRAQPFRVKPIDGGMCSAEIRCRKIQYDHDW